MAENANLASRRGNRLPAEMPSAQARLIYHQRCGRRRLVHLQPLLGPV